MRRAATTLLGLLFVLSGICTNLCAAPAPADSQHACCPHHQQQQSDKPCGHTASGQDSQAIVKQISSSAPLALLPRPYVFAAPLIALATPAPSAITADTSPRLHLILRL